MKPYEVTLLISITIIFILRIFYAEASVNISHNLNLFSASELYPFFIKTVLTKKSYPERAGFIF